MPFSFKVNHSQNNTMNSKRFLQIYVLAVLIISFALPVSAAPPTVVIKPFTINAAKDMSYLKSGIRSMLASRLADNAGVNIVPPEAGADYSLKGSMTVFGGSYSLDVTLAPVQGGQSRKFYATAATEGGIIKAVNSLSWDIAEKVFGKKRPTTALSASAPRVAAIATPAAAASPYRTANPELAFRAGLQGGYGGSLLRPQGVITGLFGFSKSQNFRFGLVAMGVGDVDGDGKTEFVLAAKHEIRIFRRLGNRFQKIWQMSTSERYAIHAITMADLNKNGRQEIYVSAADAKRPNSFILEWDGKKFVKLADNQRWYIRAINIPGEGRVLAGQKGGFGTLLAPGIYRLKLKNGQLVKTGMVPVNGVNLFDFSIVDLDGDGRHEVVAISHGDKILVLRPSGKVMWVSDDYYGGTTTYLGGIGFDDINKDLENGSYEAPRIYVPARIIIRDVNGDGRPDIIINRNLSSASRIMGKYKSYPSGEIDALTWNGIGLTELWRTRKIDGYIADYHLGPIKKPAAAAKNKNSAGTVNLYVGIILHSGGINILSDATSTVLTFPLQLQKRIKQQQTVK